MFQYSFSILSALQSLPRDEYSIVVAYADDTWGELIDRDTECLPLKMSAAFKAFAAIFAAVGLSHQVWLGAAPQISKTVRAIVAKSCDLWIFPAQDLWSSRFPVPALAAIHDLMHRYEPQFPEVSARGRSIYRDHYFKDLCATARGILMNSELGKKHVHESYGVGSDRLFVLPYVPPAYLYRSQPSADFDAKYQLPERFLFYPARFWQHKNHLGLLDAVSEARRQVGDIQLVLAGSLTNEYPAISRRVGQLGLQKSVHFVGYVPDNDLAEFYRRSRALIFPTFFGPTNIPLLEAFAIGCPVAVSRIYGMPEQVQGAALLFDPHSVEEMADCIRRLWCDDQLCEQLIARGKRRSEDWESPHFQSAIQRILLQCISNSGQYRTRRGLADQFL